MEKEDILHLARLSRIGIDDKEAESLKADIESVLSYVSDINSITADVTLTKKVGARYNIFRDDVVTVREGSYTDAILKEAPNVKGQHLQVKKILQMD
jgi:aspartyl-tRNA(Asn)/glutamyl-tRNA(Gln) amidotransferase subunit C